LQERRAEALELRRQGYSYPQIGRELKIATSTAFDYV
jgi:DNA-binding NarL/FixJ family response regulator